jgi:hypothetical protein
VAWMLGSLAVWLFHGLKVSLWPWDLFFACDCGKLLNLRGLAGGQAYFDELLKYISKLLLFFAGNPYAMF